VAQCIKKIGLALPKKQASLQTETNVKITL